MESISTHYSPQNLTITYTLLKRPRDALPGSRRHSDDLLERVVHVDYDVIAAVNTNLVGRFDTDFRSGNRFFVGRGTGMSSIERKSRNVIVSGKWRASFYNEVAQFNKGLNTDFNFQIFAE